jgi:hypothetical protein
VKKTICSGRSRPSAPASPTSSASTSCTPRATRSRCLGQAELIRQKINVSKLRAQADKRESALQETRRKIDQARKALGDTVVKKKAMEANVK